MKIIEITDYVKKLESDEMMNTYLGKLEADKKMNTFFRYFKLPKNQVVFNLFTAATTSIIICLAENWILSIILSVVAVFIMWNVWIPAVEMVRIAEECAAEERAWQKEFIEEGMNADCMINFPDDTMYVTDEDRKYFMLIRVLNYWNLTMKEKIKYHRTSLKTVTITYIIVYVLMYGIAHLVR
jgi:hypothetical protein